ncbi:Uncharacterized protein APZ42_027967 [Daphnia magna]|uniref:Uncharacterized protein n=1 Tax=Daphnia magna TaxID=35525 RepID=A0A164QY52_9CRUS|nr:Uncharacterized protein APZ42_027967 [Daphnia magna]
MRKRPKCDELFPAQKSPPPCHEEASNLHDAMVQEHQRIPDFSKTCIEERDGLLYFCLSFGYWKYSQGALVEVNANHLREDELTAGIKFQESICGRCMKINQITTDFFGQHIIVPETVALETSLTECTIMAKTKRWNDVQMNLTDDKWTYTPDPSTIGSWFSTVSPYVINCMMEETRLIRQGEDDIIETPLGKAKVSDGIHTHNHLTIIWDITIATASNNTPRFVSSGEGALIKTSTPGTFRLKDEKQQLAFHIKPEGRCLTTACRHKNESFTVIGDEHLFISIPHLDDDSEESDYEPPQRETTTLSN